MSLASLEASLGLYGFLISSWRVQQSSVVLGEKANVTILALGESTTAAPFFENDISWPKQLEAILNNEGRNGASFAVINKGESGTNTERILERYEEYLNEYRPDIVVAMMGVNDAEVVPWTKEYVPHAVKPKPESSLAKKALFWLSEIRLVRLAKLIVAKVVSQDSTTDPHAPLDSQEGDVATEPLGEYESVLEEAEAAFDDRNTEEVERLARRAIELNPVRGEAYSLLGRYYHTQKRFLAFEEVMLEAVRVNPDEAWAHVGLANAYVNLERLEEAEAELLKAIEVNKEAAYAYILLGHKMLDEGRYKDAEELFGEVLAFDPGNKQAKAALAEVFNKSGREHLAVEIYESSEAIPFQTADSYQKIVSLANERGIKFVAVQYPLLNMDKLETILTPNLGGSVLAVSGNPDLFLVDNEGVFKKALKSASYEELFADDFAGSFGHATKKGNFILASNIAETIMNKVLP